MKRTIIFGVGALIFALLFIRPLAPIQGVAQEYSESKILIEYEIFGCGNLIVKVNEGGESMASLLRSDYPDIATDEVQFTPDSDQPIIHLSSADFFTAGLARGYNYIVEGEVVGATKGALDCCTDEVAYNDIVPEFKVKRWYATKYMPYFMYGDGPLILVWFVGAIACLVGTIISAVQMRRAKRSRRA